MEDFVEAHLGLWLKNTTPWDEIDAVKQGILKVVNEHPDLLNDRSWPEIRDMAESVGYIKQ